MTFRLIATFVAVFLAVPTTAQMLPTESDLRRHIDILASDDFEGRLPGTAGEALTASYIAQQFSAAGLLPGYRGNYFQPVALLTREDDRATLRTHGPNGSRDHAVEFLALGNDDGVMVENMPVLFVGYGLSVTVEDDIEPDDRYAGQTILLLRGRPEEISEGPSFRRLITHFRQRGATAVIGIVEPDVPWDAAANGMRFRQTYLASETIAEVEAILSTNAAEAVLNDAGRSLEELSAMAAAGNFEPFALNLNVDIRVSTIFDRFDGINIVAQLPGNGGSDQAVLFSAHHDHFGICRPEAKLDQICNGAVDNASGIAALIETARFLAATGPHDRDIMFVATTAEEYGLLGAQAFVRDPPIPLETIIAAFNLDMIAIGSGQSPVGIIGRNLTELDELVDTVIVEQGRAVYLGAELDEYVRRSDLWAFLQFDVPAVMVGSSFTDPELLTSFLRSRYHRPEDEAAGLDLRGAWSDTILHIALGRAFADPVRYPGPQR